MQALREVERDRARQQLTVNEGTDLHYLKNVILKLFVTGSCPPPVGLLAACHEGIIPTFMLLGYDIVFVSAVSDRGWPSTFAQACKKNVLSPIEPYN